MLIRPGYPDFQDLPWHLPLTHWLGNCLRLVDVPRGLSRHPVAFVNYEGVLYALKEMPPGLAEREYHILEGLEDARLPTVTPVGHLSTHTGQGAASVLITRYLESGLPYRSLFMSSSLMRYRKGLLDAMAGLLVQLHLAEVYWGDCSLSNTLFRRDAGALQAYLVDAETSEIYSDGIPAAQRYYDLEIMQENIDGDLADLSSANLLAEGVPVSDTGAYICQRYQRLWEEITREELIHPDEHYRIQERIRALNGLGFSIGEVQLTATHFGDQLRLKVVVTDRHFHQQQLLNLTGLDTQEMQARQIMNEIQEFKANLSRQSNRSMPLSVAAYQWLEQVYHPAIERLQELRAASSELPELYCQVLEHKWFLSEREQRNVGHQAAIDDYLRQFKE
jgi:hypothetical protein